MASGYVVFQRSGEGEWRVLGEVARRPGIPSRRSRVQAVREVLGREPEDDEAFAVLLRSEWRVSLDCK